MCKGAAMRDLLRYVRTKQTPRGDFAQAVAAFNAENPILDVFDGHDLKRIGREHHGPCPICGGSDRFTVWPHEGRAWCRQCKALGDSVTWAMRRNGHDPGQRGETARYLVAKGYLQPQGRPPERKPTPTPTRDTPETNLGAISDYETEWIAEREAILIVDAGFGEAEAATEARRLLAVIHAREGAARGKR